METSIKDYLTVQVQLYWGPWTNTVNKNSKQIWFKFLKKNYNFLKRILFEAISSFCYATDMLSFLKRSVQKFIAIFLKTLILKQRNFSLQFRKKKYWKALPWSVGEIKNDLSFNWRIYACPYFVVLSDIFILFFSQSSSRHSTINYCRHFSWVCHWPCCFFLCYNRHHHHKVNVNCVHLHAIF